MSQPTATQTPEPYITVSRGGSGYFAVHLWWNPEMDGFYEPWETGLGRYADPVDAEREAIAWARDEGIRYQPPNLEGLTNK